MKVIPLILLLSTLVLSADLPDAKALLSESARKLFSRPFRMATHTEVRFEDAKSSDVSMDAKLATDGRLFRMEVGPDIELAFVLLSDGQFTYLYITETNQYTKKPSVRSPQAMAASMVPGADASAEKIAAVSRSHIVREETLQIGGEPRACYVVESTFDQLTLASAVALSNGRTTTWIDKERGIAMKQISDYDMQSEASSAPTREHRQTTVTSIEVAPAFAAADFVFTPPAGARQVDDQPSVPQKPETLAVVQEPVADMYSKPDAQADVVSQAIYSTPVTILEAREGWARIQTPDHYTGWILLGSILVLPEGQKGYAEGGRVAEVQSLFANLYGEPDVTRHKPLLTVPFETRLEVTAEPEDDGGRWICVRLPGVPASDRTWIARGDVAFDAARLTVADLPAFSKRFLGLPYLWGGTSTFGYDCSGFVQMLYRRAGVLLPRDAQPQADWSGFVPADRKHLRPGDLLYFGSSDRHITHTGMYLGNGAFISATVHEHPMVRIDRLNDPFWSKLFVAARRLK